MLAFPDTQTLEHVICQTPVQNDRFPFSQLHFIFLISLLVCLYFLDTIRTERVLGHMFIKPMFSLEVIVMFFGCFTILVLNFFFILLFVFHSICFQIPYLLP